MIEVSRQWLLNVSFYALPCIFTLYMADTNYERKKNVYYILQFNLCKDTCCFHVARQMYIVT